MKQKINLLKQEIINHFNNINSTHDLDHTLRVFNLAIHIGKIENADLDILEASVLLHDVARHDQDKSAGKICHAELGGIKARDLLIKKGFSDDFIEKVVHAITCHRFRGKNIPESLEAKILFDADKLDGIGAIGLGRAFQFSGEHHAKLHDSIPNISPEAEYTKDDTAYREFVVKLSKVKDKLFTQEARNIAESRHKFMIDFFERLEGEIKGEI